MKKEKRSVKIQVRVSQAEKDMLDEMSCNDNGFSISKMVREAITNEYRKSKGLNRFQ